jgi:acylphosphatase
LRERGSDVRAIEVRVGGRVQGVGFRWFVVRAAEAHGVRGWVRNRDDGDVELRAEGPRDVIESFLSTVRLGPPAARVERFDAREVESGGQGPGFGVRP